MSAPDRLPRYAIGMGIALADGAENGALLMMPYGDHLRGRPGFLHGGAIAGLLEITAHIALRRALGAEPVRIKPVSVTVDFMRGGRTVTTYAAATISRLGARIANVETHAWQGDPAKPIASARMTMLLDR